MSQWIITNSFPVVPALEVHVLSDQLDGRLGTVHLQRGHVEVVDEEHEVLAQGWSEHTLTSGEEI